jgi:hypothetical protein
MPLPENFIRYTAHCISACDENLVTEINTALIRHMTMITIFSKCVERIKKGNMSTLSLSIYKSRKVICPLYLWASIEPGKMISIMMAIFQNQVKKSNKLNFAITLRNILIWLIVDIVDVNSGKFEYFFWSFFCFTCTRLIKGFTK